MEKLIVTLFLLVISAIGTWLQKRGAQKTDEGTPGTPSQQPPPKASSWEDELRRLLEGEAPVSPKQVRRPPVVVAQSPKAPPMAAPPVVIKPVLVAKPRPAMITTPVESAVEASARTLAPMAESKQAYERASQLDKNYSTREMAPLRESRQAFDRASQLDKVAAAHIEKVPGQRVAATGVMRRSVSPEITQVMSLFKSARTARQAVIASIVLGPPRATEELTAAFDR